MFRTINQEVMPYPMETTLTVTLPQDEAEAIPVAHHPVGRAPAPVPVLLADDCPPHRTVEKALLRIHTEAEVVHLIILTTTNEDTLILQAIHTLQVDLDQAEEFSMLLMIDNKEDVSGGVKIQMLKLERITKDGGDIKVCCSTIDTWAKCLTHEYGSFYIHK